LLSHVDGDAAVMWHIFSYFLSAIIPLSKIGDIFAYANCPEYDV